MVVRKKLKEKCKDAARMRREKERVEFIELSKLLPLPSTITCQLDKASIIRLTSSYLKLRRAFPKGLGQDWGHAKEQSVKLANSSGSGFNANNRHHNQHQPFHTSLSSICSNHQYRRKTKQASLQLQTLSACQALSLTKLPFGIDLGTMLLQTLEGFVFVLHPNGKIMYVSETASVNLGLAQIELTGSSIYDIVSPIDQDDLKGIFNLTESDKYLLNSADPSKENIEIARSFCLRMKCILPKRNAGLVNAGYKVIHFYGYLKVKPTTISTKSYNKLEDSSSHHHQPLQETNETTTDWECYALVALGHSLLPAATTELKLCEGSFIFKASLDFKLYSIEASVTKILEFDQHEMIGRSLYQFLHVDYIKLFEKSHKLLLEKGQMLTRYHRLMKKHGGSVWIQTHSAIVNNPKHLFKSQYIVGVCFFLSETNQPDESCIHNEELLNRPLSYHEYIEDSLINNHSNINLELKKVLSRRKSLLIPKISAKVTTRSNKSDDDQMNEENSDYAKLELAKVEKKQEDFKTTTFGKRLSKKKKQQSSLAPPPPPSPRKRKRNRSSSRGKRKTGSAVVISNEKQLQTIESININNDDHHHHHHQYQQFEHEQFVEMSNNNNNNSPPQFSASKYEDDNQQFNYHYIDNNNYHANNNSSSDLNSTTTTTIVINPSLPVGCSRRPSDDSCSIVSSVASTSLSSSNASQQTIDLPLPASYNNIKIVEGYNNDLTLLHNHQHHHHHQQQQQPTTIIDNHQQQFLIIENCIDSSYNSNNGSSCYVAATNNIDDNNDNNNAPALIYGPNQELTPNWIGTPNQHQQQQQQQQYHHHHMLALEQPTTNQDQQEPQSFHRCPIQAAQSFSIDNTNSNNTWAPNYKVLDTNHWRTSGDNSSSSIYINNCSTENLIFEQQLPTTINSCSHNKSMNRNNYTDSTMIGYYDNCYNNSCLPYPEEEYRIASANHHHNYR